MRPLDLSTTLLFLLGWSCDNGLGPACAVTRVGLYHLGEFYKDAPPSLLLSTFLSEIHA